MADPIGVALALSGGGYRAMTPRVIFYATSLRLNEFSEREQGELINRGHALTDAAMRRWVVPEAPPATAWPVPEFAR
jgi:hypothetical protein